MPCSQTQRPTRPPALRHYRAVSGDLASRSVNLLTAKTYKSDAALPRLVPTSLAALQVGAVTDREVSRALIALVRSGLAESSVKRLRDSLSAFFAWAVRERMIPIR